ncbi:MAG: T9SS type A sorting domain-containing protein [Candidatus Marinimicrobia bacterium]|nr:T9SS type A sorting domain-containing protein [Candidatus Neomarinimicrobiota bacterium]
MKKISLIVVVLYLVTLLVAEEMIPAFPGAEGWGKYTIGGRGGRLIEVTNLNDSGEGSLRWAVESEGPRIVIFRVSGTIELRSPLRIENPYITIAGQTAPGDGICVKNYPIMINTDQVIIRYLRIRLGDASGGEYDAMGSRYHKHIIIDHCSLSWSVDETISLYHCDSLTIQWCIISESLYNSVHSKGHHGFGAIWGGPNSSYHHNLFAHHSSRTPRFASGSGNTDFRNNVIYNWRYNNVYGGEAHDDDWPESPYTTVNIVANYYKYGPATSKDERRYRIVNPSSRSGLEDYGKWYVADNYVWGYPNVTEDNWRYGVQGVSKDVKEYIRSDTPFEYMPITQHTAEEAFNLVLQNAGATLPRRDSIDIRIVEEVYSGTATYGASYGAGTGIIDSPEDVGGWSILRTGPAVVDTDHDGMPDEWEIENGLDPENPDDRNIRHESGYTMVEIYLNSITEYPEFVANPTELEAKLYTLNSVKLTWDDNSTNEKGFVIERKEEGGDFVAIDTVGADTTSFLDSNLDNFKTFQYRVYAYNNTVELPNSGYSNVVSIMTLSPDSPPLKAENPFPEDGAVNVKLDVILRWTAGVGADSHIVYFGTEKDNMTFIKSTCDTFFVPDKLEPNTTYYWRIDEKNSNGITKGDVWTFTTKEILPPQVVAYWDFDEIRSDSVIDKSDHNNDGRMYNMDASSIVTGLGGSNALKFDGIDDYINVANSDVIDFDKGSFSVSVWYSPINITESSIYILHKGTFERNDVACTSGKWYGIELKNWELRFAIDDDVTKTTAKLTGINNVINEGKWYHIVGVRDTSANKVKLYLNGNLVAEVDDQTGDISQGEDLFIGNCSNIDAPLSGILDELKIFNYSLSDEEISDLYYQFAGNPISKGEIPTIPNRLYQNYPNPFNPSTTIKFSINEASNVKIVIYDLTGKKVKTIVDNKYNPGVYQVVADFSDLSSGVYFYQITTNNFTKVKKMILLK